MVAAVLMASAPLAAASAQIAAPAIAFLAPVLVGIVRLQTGTAVPAAWIARGSAAPSVGVAMAVTVPVAPLAAWCLARPEPALPDPTGRGPGASEPVARGSIGPVPTGQAWIGLSPARESSAPLSGDPPIASAGTATPAIVVPRPAHRPDPGFGMAIDLSGRLSRGRPSRAPLRASSPGHPARRVRQAAFLPPRGIISLRRPLPN